MTYEAATEKVRRYLKKKHAANNEDVSIYTWTGKRYGIRVSEVTFSTGTAGASFMQSDPDGLSLCARVERCIIAYAENWPRTEIAFELDALDWLLRKEAA